MNSAAAFKLLSTAVGADADGPTGGDYPGADGLLYCGACHEPKERRLPVPALLRDEMGDEIRRPCECACQRERRLLEDAAREEYRHRDAVKRLRLIGIKDPRLLECTFAADDGKDKKIGEVCRRYAEKWAEMREKNIGMMLWGAVGAGKTFYAACIANALIDREASAILTSLPDLSAAMMKDYGDGRESVLGEIQRVSLLVLDDVGFERGTPAAAENAYSIIDARYTSGKPLIVTTNLTPDEIKNPENVAHKRTFDRIIEMCPIVLQSTTARRAGLAEKRRVDALEILYGGAGDDAS